MADETAAPQQARLEKLASRLQWLLPLFGGSLALVVLCDRLGLADPQRASRPALAVSVAIALVQLASALRCVIISAMWLHRASANLAERGLPMRHSPTGAWGWYFLPIANLFKPLGAMKEIWAASIGTDGSVGTTTDPLLVRWWSAWIVGNIALSMSARTESIGGTSMAIVLDVVGVVALFAAGLFFARIVDAVTSSQGGASTAATFA